MNCDFTATKITLDNFYRKIVEFRKVDPLNFDILRYEIRYANSLLCDNAELRLLK